MNDTAKIDRAIRINTIGAGVWVVLVALRLGLSAAGLLPWDLGTVVWLTFGVGAAAVALQSARSLGQDRDDPAGIERRFEAQANVLGAGVIVIGLAAVIGLIAWGLAG